MNWLSGITVFPLPWFMTPLCVISPFSFPLRPLTIVLLYRSTSPLLAILFTVTCPSLHLSLRCLSTLRSTPSTGAAATCTTDWMEGAACQCLILGSRAMMIWTGPARLALDHRTLWRGLHESVGVSIFHLTIPPLVRHGSRGKGSALCRLSCVLPLCHRLIPLRLLCSTPCASPRHSMFDFL